VECLSRQPTLPATVVTTDTASTLATLGITITGDGDYSRPATWALITVENYSVRMGTAPTTSVGHLLAPGDTVELQSLTEVSLTKFISAIAGKYASLQVTLFFTDI